MPIPQNKPVYIYIHGFSGESWLTQGLTEIKETWEKKSSDEAKGTEVNKEPGT